MPISEANFISEGFEIPTKFRPIFRFKGSHAAKSLFGFLEMTQTVDQSKFNNESQATDTFAMYVQANKKCSVCGKTMQLKKSKKGKFFLACSGYPSCSSTDLIDVDFVDDYFYRNGPKGQHCPQCNCSLEAKIGPYGLYIQCCGMSHHRYKLDEI